MRARAPYPSPGMGRSMGGKCRRAGRTDSWMVRRASETDFHIRAITLNQPASLLGGARAQGPTARQERVLPEADPSLALGTTNLATGRMPCVGKGARCPECV